MDAVLANSQANLALRQRDLAKQVNYQLHDTSVDERAHVHETEELLRMTRDLKTDLDNRVPLTDPIAQIQQKKIQLVIAERQYSAAESQIRIVQAHLLSGMDHSKSQFGSALGRQSDMRVTEELQKQAQPLLSEAQELLKKARHSVTFAELGARQRLRSGSFNREYEQPVTSPIMTNEYYGRENEMHVHAPPPTLTITPPTPIVKEAPQQVFTEVEVKATNVSRPSDDLLLEKKKKSSNKCCLYSFILLVIAGLVGGGIYALIAFDVIKV